MNKIWEEAKAKMMRELAATKAHTLKKNSRKEELQAKNDLLDNDIANHMKKMRGIKQMRGKLQ